MTTASDRVAVIATQVAQTDRRALSEAWYSALHLATADVPLPRRAALRPICRPELVEGGPPSAHHATTGAQLPPRVQRGAPYESNSAVTVDRRRPSSETARRIERAVAALTARRRVPAAHTVDVGGGRVRLLVHNDGHTTRIVALCSRPLREHVERALASARFTLAAAGLVVGAP